MRLAALAGLSPRGAGALVLFVAILLILPLWVGNYILSVLVVVLLAAYVGLCWNIMMGFVGQLSLGHALFLGLGAYVSGALFVRFGVAPWLGMLAGMAVAGCAGGIIGALGFRFGVTGVYFALLTIAFAEFTRILFDHFAWVGGSSGLFLPVSNLRQEDLVHLRGSPAMFYYVLVALVLAVMAASHFLLRRRIGFYWQAIREDQEAASALGIDIFRYKLVAVMLSAALTSVGGAVMAFYDNNLYPDSEFAIARSVEIIAAPIIGGVGTLMGPIIGAFVLTTLGEVMTQASAQFGVNGLKQWFYGAALLLIVMLQPAGLWPWLRRKLKLASARR